MKILLVADHEDEKVWNYWDAVGKNRFAGVDLILSAGDIKAAYLEFLVTMLNVPCLYVRGNHDQMYHEQPPRGCVCIEDGVIEVIEYEDSGRVMLKEEAIRTQIGKAVRSGAASDISGRMQAIRHAVKRASEIDPAGIRTVRIAGLGGSMRYREGPDMYTEREMSRRAGKLKKRIERGLITRTNGKRALSRDLASAARRAGTASVASLSDDIAAASEPAPVIDILLTHAPCRGHGDLNDLAHTGFDCFNKLLHELKPRYHCYGHVHMEYGMVRRESEHPSGTRLLNVSGSYILEI